MRRERLDLLVATGLPVPAFSLSTATGTAGGGTPAGRMRPGGAASPTPIEERRRGGLGSLRKSDRRALAADDVGGGAVPAAAEDEDTAASGGSAASATGGRAAIGRAATLCPDLARSCAARRFAAVATLLIGIGAARVRAWTNATAGV